VAAATNGATIPWRAPARCTSNRISRKWLAIGESDRAGRDGPALAEVHGAVEQEVPVSQGQIVGGADVGVDPVPGQAV